MYQGTVLASAHDLELPNGCVELSDAHGDVVASQTRPSIERCRVHVAVVGREVAGKPDGLRWDAPNRGELFTITIYPTDQERHWWSNGLLDAMGEPQRTDFVAVTPSKQP